jgi:hypothetical protein
VTAGNFARISVATGFTLQTNITSTSSVQVYAMGSGTLDLTGVSAMAAGSSINVNSGNLQVDGMLSGATVYVAGQNLSGSGTISGPVFASLGSITSSGSLGDVTTNQTLVDPGGSAATASLQTGNLTLQLGTYAAELNSGSPGSGYDQLVVNGAVNITNGTALQLTLGYTPPVGQAFTLIDNLGSGAVQGTFSNLAEGGLLTIGTLVFQITYKGGDGNDVVLTRIPADIWTGGGTNGNWSTAANWRANVAPSAGDTLVFPANVSQVATNNDFPTGTAFNAILIGGNGYTLSGNGIVLNGNLDTSVSGSNITVSIPLTLGAPLSFVGPASSSFQININGNVALNGSALTLGLGHVVVNGTVSGTGGLIESGGTGELTAANSYSGTTQIGGTLLIDNSQALGVADGTAANGVSTTNSNNGTFLILNGSFNVGNKPLTLGQFTFLESLGNSTWGGLVTAGNFARISVATGFTLQTNITSTSSVQVYTMGSGTLDLTGVSAMAAGSSINVNSGNLQVDGTLSGATVYLAGQNLSGSGTISEPVFASLGSITSSGSLGDVTTNQTLIDPGGSAATASLQTGNLTLQLGTYAAELNSGSPGSGYDQLVVNGAVNITNGTALQLSLGFLPSIGQAFTIIANRGTGAVNGIFNGLAEGALLAVGNVTFQITYQGGAGHDVVVTCVSIGKPTVVIPNQSNAEGASVALDLRQFANDLHGPPLTFSVTGLPPGLSVNGNVITGTLSGQAADGSPYSVTVTASDGVHVSDPASFSWFVQDVTTPVLTVPNQTNSPGDPVALPMTTSDADNDPVTITSVNGLPFGLSYNATTHRVEGTVSSSAANQTFFVSVSFTDGHNPSSGSFQWQIVPALIAGRVNATSGVEGASAASLNAKFTASTGAHPSDFTALVHWGDNTTSAGTISGTGGSYSVSGSHVYAEEGFYGISVDVADMHGDSVTMFGSTSVTDATLTAGAASVPNAVEGSSAPLGASFTDANTTAAPTDFTAFIQWGDFSSSFGVVTGSGSNYNVSAAHVYAEAGTYSLTISVTDRGGSRLNMTSTTIVSDAPLTPGSVNANGGTEGNSQGSLFATFFDADPSSSSNDITALIDWGDNSTSPGNIFGNGGSFYVQGLHQYAEDGTYSITIHVTDREGSTTTIVGSTTVLDAPVVGSSLSASGGIEGSVATTLNASFFDYNSEAPTSDFTAVIYWGDSSTSVGVVTGGNGNYAVSGSHVYADEGSYPILITVGDSGGSNGYINGSTFVSDAALSASSAPFIVAAGATFTQPVATFVDANPVAPLSDITATINWGDSTSSPGTITQPGGIGTGFVVTGTHSYASAGSNTVTVTIVDDGGQTATTSFTVTVTGGRSFIVLDPSASGALTLSGNAGINISGTVVVDSNSSSAISMNGNTQLSATTIEVIGGIQKNGNATVSGAITHGSVPDPLASLSSPSTTGLNSYGAINLSGNASQPISQGIYTSIQVSGNATLSMNPGIYIIKGGGLSVTGNASISGNGVFIYNAGSNYPLSGGTFGGISLGGNGNFSLTAPTSGTYAGILIFQSRQNTRALSFTGNAFQGTTGTIYAANALLNLSGNAQLRGNSLIVGTLNLTGNGSLTQLAQGTDGGDSATAIADTLLGGNLAVYVSDPAGSFTPDMHARIADAINGIDALLVPYNVIITEVTEPSLANVILDNGTDSASGSMSNGVLGCYNPAAAQVEITMIQGWNWYAGSDASQIGADQYDFQTTVTHEFGHAIGLGGSASNTSPMNENLPIGTARRSLTAADLNVPEPPDGADPLTAAGFRFGMPASASHDVMQIMASATLPSDAILDKGGVAGTHPATTSIAEWFVAYVGADDPQLGEGISRPARAQTVNKRSQASAAGAEQEEWKDVLFQGDCRGTQRIGAMLRSSGRDALALGQAGSQHSTEDAILRGIQSKRATPDTAAAWRHAASTYFAKENWVRFAHNDGTCSEPLLFSQTSDAGVGALAALVMVFGMYRTGDRGEAEQARPRMESARLY